MPGCPISDQEAEAVQPRGEPPPPQAPSQRLPRHQEGRQVLAEGHQDPHGVPQEDQEGRGAGRGRPLSQGRAGGVSLPRGEGPHGGGGGPAGHTEVLQHQLRGYRRGAGGGRGVGPGRDGGEEEEGEEEEGGDGGEEEGEEEEGEDGGEEEGEEEEGGDGGDGE